MREILFSALLPFLSIASHATAEEPKIRVESDVLYSKVDPVELRLNVARPGKGDGPFPAVVCIHGGGWFQGQRQDMDAMTELLAKHGYVAVTISYRLAPTRFPAQIEDCKAAVRWLRANAKKYQINPDRIGAIGPSARATGSKNGPSRSIKR
jgi:acetyl esterase/lipase